MKNKGRKKKVKSMKDLYRRKSNKENQETKPSKNREITKQETIK